MKRRNDGFWDLAERNSSLEPRSVVMRDTRAGERERILIITRAEVRGMRRWVRGERVRLRR